MLNLTESFGLGIKISEIRTLSFIIEDSGLAATDLIRIDFNHTIKLTVPESFVVFTLVTTFVVVEGSNERMVLDCAIQNVFEVDNLAQYANEKELKLNLPPGIVVSMVGLSVSHARAIISGLTKGTNLQGFIIPIVDPVKTAAAFFPDNNLVHSNETVKEVEDIELTKKKLRKEILETLTLNQNQKD